MGEVASANGTVRNCGNLGTVSATKFEAGGIIATGYKSGPLLIENCYNLGAVTAAESTYVAGGIFGRAPDKLQGTAVTIKSCYSSAVLGGAGSTAGVAQPGSSSGGSVTVSNCAFDTTLASTATAGTGVVGVTTDDLLTWGAAYYLNGGFTGGTANDGNVANMTAWRMDTSSDNDGFPVPMVNYATGAPEGSMASAEDWNDVGAYVAAFHEGEPSYDSANGGWQVGTPEQLACVAYLVNNHNGDINAADASSRTYAESPLKLTESVDMTGARYSTSATATAPLQWIALGERDDAPFAASFDGGLKVVTGLEAFGYSGGLIGTAGAPGVTVTDLGVELAGSGSGGD
ncbi:MAG: hypothetical protein ACLSVD_14095 [Eggerthellaceae bacterium]